MKPSEFTFVSRLEKQVTINTQMAVAIGIKNSIILQQIHYWIKQKEEYDLNFVDDRYWVYNSVSEWQKQFPFFSRETIKRCLKELEDLEIIISANHHKDPFNKSKWYTIDYVKLRTAISV